LVGYSHNSSCSFVRCRGTRQGIIKTVFGIAGLIGGIVLAGRYYDELAAVLSSSGATWVNIAAYAIILIATLIVAGVIGRLVAKLVHLVLLGWLDRLVGCILGHPRYCS